MIRLLLSVSLSLASLLPALAEETGPVREGPKILDPAESLIGRQIDDVAFTDSDGKPGKLSDFAGRAALVLAVTNAGCPLSKKYAPRLASLNKQYQDKGVAFVLFNSVDTPEAIRASIERNAFTMRYIVDRKDTLAGALRARTSTEVFVLDASRMLRYRGAIDDQYGLGYEHDKPRREYLREALEALLAKRKIEAPATSAPGCELPVPAASAAPGSVTYHNQISRIFQKKCQECHRPGSSGPFSLLNYDDVMRHNKAIRRVVHTRVMPPWFADPKIGKWANDRSLSEQEMKTLLDWIDGGCAEGDAKDSPPPRTFAEGWTIGKPDVVVQIPKPIKIPAEGTLPYQYVYIKTTFDSDRWVQAIEMMPTQPQLVHHAQVFLMMDGKALYEEKPPVNGGRPTSYFAAMAPGETSLVFPEGSAKLLQKGATLEFEIHYTPDGVAVEDQMKLGLIFAKTKPKYEVRSFDIRNTVFEIPAGVENISFSAEYAVPTKARLLAFQPHMHLRGKSFTFDLIHPDGKQTPILSVPRYDFKWQISYRLEKPLDVAAGSKIKVTGTFDNSANNPANPDPKKIIRNGGGTLDEMLVGFGEWHELFD